MMCGVNCCAAQKTTTDSQKFRRDNVPFENDISGRTQAQLGDYIRDRTNPPDTDPSIQFVTNTIDNTDDPHNLLISMQLTDGTSFSLPIPTSNFQEFGDTAFSLAVASLYGCTVVTWVGKYDENNPQNKVGVWMSHMWE